MMNQEITPSLESLNQRVRFLGLFFGFCLCLCSCSNEKESENQTSGENTAQPSLVADSADSESQPVTAIRSDSVATAPGLGSGNREYVAPLADAYSRIDPTKDGWQSEAFSEAATKELKALAKSLSNPEKLKKGELTDIFAPSALLSLTPASTDSVFNDDVFSVRRGSPDNSTAPLPPVEAFQSFLKPLTPSGHLQIGVKLYKVEPAQDSVQTRVYILASGISKQGKLQINTEWLCTWTPDTSKPKLQSVRFLAYEEAEFLGGEGNPLLVDVTKSVFQDSDVFRNQILVDTDYWRSRIPRIHGLDVVANHGLALGDINGDGLEDLYLCQQGGLPNRLFIQEPDGGLKDFTQESNTGWLDYCSAALLLDFDNDGDSDLIISQDFQIILMENNGSAVFSDKGRLPTRAQTFSLSASDYDLDGDLDFFACGYNPSADREQTGTMGEPMPYHDAQNGGENILFQNQGNWTFEDVTNSVGLNQNNNRFSFAAAWVDFDNDGDLDLYVANDYGRNNLYENDDFSFRDIAAEAGVEDMSAGMSTSWADANRDGALDLYVSNMFSAAGNRITFQRQFKSDINDDGLKSAFQRHARGNSLFFGSIEGQPFTDVTMDMGVSMGRWAWGSRFADLNNDGWEDIVVANGFISTPDTTDL